MLDAVINFAFWGTVVLFTLAAIGVLIGLVVHAARDLFARWRLPHSK